MRKQFLEYYGLSEQQIQTIWANSLIVFDTNVLLNLYRYNKDASNEFLKVIETYSDRLWIPYQVGLEFHRRREEIIRKHASAYGDLGNELSTQLVKSLEALTAKYSRHPYININDVKKKLQRTADSISRSLAKQGEQHPDYLSNDHILDSVTRLFDGRTGFDFSEDVLENVYKEGEKRYANQVPPGFCDEKNKKGQSKRSLYGDLIVWKQTIQHCKEQNRHLIFVTDDHKADWWEKVEGKHSPRKELIKEFINNTGCDIIIYDSQRFLEYAKSNNDFKVSSKTIKEVNKVQINNSRYWKKLRESIEKISDSHDYNQQLDFQSPGLPSWRFNDYIHKLTGLSNSLEHYKRLEKILDEYRILYGEIIEENEGDSSNEG